MRTPKPSDNCAQAVCSVSEMAHRCGLSRARFYELVTDEVMPRPCYDVWTRRPVYPLELQDLCRRVRQTNIGANGRYVLFNNRRKPASETNRARPGRGTRPCSPDGRDGRYSELIDSLRAIGVTAPESDVQEVLAACYPDGVLDGDAGAAIRAVLRHLRRAEQG